MLARKQVSRVARFVVIAFLSAQIAACFSEHTDSTGLPEDCDIPASAQGAGKAVVTISGYRFAPETLRIAPGTTVTWVNCDKVAGTTDRHTSTSDTGVWSSPFFGLGETYVKSFAASGNFPYHCVPHSSMRAVILVQ